MIVFVLLLFQIAYWESLEHDNGIDLEHMHNLGCAMALCYTKSAVVKHCRYLDCGGTGIGHTSQLLRVLFGKHF